VDAIAESPYSVAPEKRERLRDLVRDHDVEIVFDPNRTDWALQVEYPATITLGLPICERLWAFCYAYMGLAAFLEERGYEHGEVILPTDAPWMRLLQWAMSTESQQQHPVWPQGLPRPHADPGGDPLMFEATECFLCMCGWIVLHEIGHVILGHVRDPQEGRSAGTVFERRQKEHAADAWASHWLLDDWRLYGGGGDHRVLLKRAMGAVMGLSIITSLQVYTRTEGWPHHPDPAQRLQQFLNEFAPETPDAESDLEQVAWSIPAIILQLHLVNAGREPVVPGNGYIGFRQFLGEMIRALG
jgi:hypothetical protein